MTMAWYQFSPDGSALTLRLHVQPGARANAVGGLHGDALKVRVSAPAVDNKANAAVAAFIAERFDTATRNVAVIRGATSRHKQVRILAPGADADAVLAALAGPAGATP